MQLVSSLITRTVVPRGTYRNSDVDKRSRRCVQKWANLGRPRARPILRAIARIFLVVDEDVKGSLATPNASAGTLRRGKAHHYQEDHVTRFFSASSQPYTRAQLRVRSVLATVFFLAPHFLDLMHPT